MTMSFSTKPSAEELRTLPTAQLAVIALASFGEKANPNNILRGHEQAHSRNGEPDIEQLLERFSDTWAWLVAHGLVGPHHQNSSSDWFRITDRGRGVAASGSVTQLLADQRLPDDLHPALRDAQDQFHGGNAEIAVFAAMR